MIARVGLSYAGNACIRRGRWCTLSATTSSLLIYPQFLKETRSVSFFLNRRNEKSSDWPQNKKCCQRIRSDHVHSSSTAANEEDRHIVFTKLDGENDGVAELTFNRPSAANAMGRQMLRELQSAIVYLTNHKTEVRCVVLTSSSDKVFSAGADLRERSKMTQEEAAEFVTSLRGTFDALANLPMPVVSAIEGVAVGGGLEIALTSDIIVAGEDAKFGLPETSLAIIPGAGGTQRLPRAIGARRAKELIFTARRIDAQTAHDYGLVQHIVAAGDAQGRAREIAREIALNGPLAIQAAKYAVLHGMDAASLTEAMEIERKCYQTIIPTQDRLEGLAAFREKRKPEYKGV